MLDIDDLKISKSLTAVKSYRPEEMKMVFAKLTALKEALKAADMFHEASVQFAQLEAYALIRAVELSEGEPPALTGANKTLRSKAAVWLFNMTEDERTSVIEKCKDGKTILAIYKELINPNDKEKTCAIRMQLHREVALNLKRNGVAVINTEYYKNLIGKLPKNLQEDVKDGLRSLMRKKGAVGIRDNQGTYIMPKSDNEKIKQALELRFHSIQSDFGNLLYVARQCTNKPHFFIRPLANEQIGFDAFLMILAAYYGAIELSISDSFERKLKEMLISIEKKICKQYGQDR